MPLNPKWMLRAGGIIILAIALITDLPGSWSIIASIVGIVMFFTAGPI